MENRCEMPERACVAKEVQYLVFPSSWRFCGQAYHIVVVLQWQRHKYLMPDFHLPGVERFCWEVGTACETSHSHGHPEERATGSIQSLKVMWGCSEEAGCLVPEDPSGMAALFQRVPSAAPSLWKKAHLLQSEPGLELQPLHAAKTAEWQPNR